MNRFVLPVANLPTSFYDIASEVENVFDHLFNGKPTNESKPTARYAPRLSIYEFDDKFDVTLDLPGVKPEDVQIEMKENHLSISGQRRSDLTTEGAKAWKDERLHGEFQRVLQLPDNVDAERIDAVYDAGVLKITVPKAPKPAARQIAIRSQSSPAAVTNASAESN